MYDKLKLGNKPVRLHKIPEFLQKALANCNQVTDDSALIDIHSITHMDEVREIACSFLARPLIENRTLYIVYPKSNSKQTLMNRDKLMQEGLHHGLKANKLVGVNEDFSCMGFKAEKIIVEKNPKKPSQCVNDYVDKIPLLQAQLSMHPSLLAFYDALTPGYQKSWARFVYSAVQAKTQMQRFQTMCEALALSCKDMEQLKAHHRK